MKSKPSSATFYLIFFGIYYILWGQLFHLLPSSTINFIVQPCFWIIAIAMLNSRNKSRYKVRKRIYNQLLFLCFFMGLLYVTSYFTFGIASGYGYNPYNTSPKGIFLNLWSTVPMLIGLEYLREKTLLGIRENRRWPYEVTFIFLATLMIFLPNRFLSMPSQTLEQNIQFISSMLITRATLQWMLCRASYLGGWKASGLLSLFYGTFIYFPPILPHMNWLTLTTFNTLFPLFSGLFLNTFQANNDFRFPGRIQRDLKGTLKQTLTYVIAVSIVWFSVGVFPVFPTVILTGSMQPKINPGDIVIMKRYHHQAVEIGEIIQFYDRGIFIIHRVIDKHEHGYITKGDNNTSADFHPVGSSQIQGTYLFKIPKIGKMNIWFHHLFNPRILDESIEYELGYE